MKEVTTWRLQGGVNGHLIRLKTVDKGTKERLGFLLEEFLAGDPRLEFKQVVKFLGVGNLDSLDRKIPNRT
jgi:hypothetical protein